jgi:hypothetical protein
MNIISCSTNRETRAQSLSTYFSYNNLYTNYIGGTRQRGWLRHYARSRKVRGSIPDVIRVLNSPNPSSRIMSLGLTQPLTEMSTRTACALG